MKNEPQHTAFSAGEEAEAVVRRYADTVYRLAWAYARSGTDADDIFQEVFLRYLRHAPEFESEEHRKAWLLRVTINRAKSRLAAHRLRPAPQSDDAVPFTAPETLELHEALKKLPPKYRAVIHLFYFEDCTVEEISSILNRKPATVRTQLTRARAQLAKLLNEDI